MVLTIARIINLKIKRFALECYYLKNYYDYVGKIYKLTKFGADRLRYGASTWW